MGTPGKIPRRAIEFMSTVVYSATHVKQNTYVFCVDTNWRVYISEDQSIIHFYLRLTHNYPSVKLTEKNST